MTKFAHIMRCLATLLALLPAVVGSAASGHNFTVVIDAGHGGNDNGAMGEKTAEKDINLAVAKRLGTLISRGMDDTKVIYTRDSDRFITLQDRCDIANRAKGDIFVSIHTNSLDPKASNRRTVNGASVYTLGLERADKNLDVAMRENSVMKLEDDYSTTYKGFDPNADESYIMFEMTRDRNLNQSVSLARAIQSELVNTAGRRNMGVRQAPFWVLVRTAMPAVLIELDFVCNPDVESFLASDKGRDRLAQAIYNGIVSYRKNKTAEKTAPTKPAKNNAADKKTERKNNGSKTRRDSTPPAGAKVYKVQFMTSSKALAADDSRLRDIDGLDSYRDGAIVKYTSGNFTSLGDAKRRLGELRKRFPDAFIITMCDGRRIQ